MAGIEDGHVAELLRRALDGQPAVVAQLATVPHEEVARVAGGMSLTLQRTAVVNVLQTLARSRDIEPAVQAWASFVLHGYVPGGHGPIRPIEIKFDAAFELQIVEAVVRLEELGDQVDGTISDAELTTLIADLSRPEALSQS